MLFPRRLTLALLCAPAFGIAMSYTTTLQSAPTLSVEETAALATAHASNAESSRGAVDAATRMAVTAGQLPDPVLKLGINSVPVNGPDQFSVSRDFMTVRSISVIQEFTRPDKRRAKVAHFEAEADAAEAQCAVSMANVQRNTVSVWLDRQYAEQTGTLLGHHGHPLKLALQAVTAVYHNGRGTRTDVLAMELEIQKLQDRLDENRAAVAASAVALERRISLTATRLLSKPPRLGVPLPVKRLARGELDIVLEVAAAQREVSLVESEIRAAAQAKKPDITVELVVSQHGSASSNMGSVNVNFPLPWNQGNRQDREVAARLAQTQATRARSEILRCDTQAMVGAKLVEPQRNFERPKRYDGKTLSLVSTQAEAALTVYRANTGSLLAVAEASHRTIDTELERLVLEAKTTRLWADLTFLVPLPIAQTESAIKGRK